MRPRALAVLAGELWVFWVVGLMQDWEREEERRDSKLVEFILVDRRGIPQIRREAPDPRCLSTP